MTEGERKAQARAVLAHVRAARSARRKRATEAAAAAPTVVERSTWAAKEAWWATQDRILWPLNDRVREIVERAGWRLEDAGWAVRESVLWPVSDRIRDADALQRVPVQAAIGAACVLAIATATAGALTAGFGGGPAPTTEERVALEKTTIAEPVITSRTEPAPEGPLLNGERPSFKPSANPKVIDTLRQLRKQRTLAAAGAPATGPSASEGNGAERAAAGAPASEPAGNAPSAPGAEVEGTAPIAGGEEGGESARPPREEWTPKSVSRMFASAFVLYEIGRGNEKTETIFRQTAGKQLVQSLLDRPPRQPAGERVPRAEVANVVEGKRDGKKLTVSVSLVRISGLSELRLDLRKSDNGWRVVSVRG